MLGWWGFLSKRQRKSVTHCQSTYHDTLILSNFRVQRHQFMQVCAAVLLCYSLLTLCYVYALSLHAAAGPVRTMELVYLSTRTTALSAYARRDSQGNTANRRVIQFPTLTCNIIARNHYKKKVKSHAVKFILVPVTFYNIRWHKKTIHIKLAI